MSDLYITKLTIDQINLRFDALKDIIAEAIPPYDAKDSKSILRIYEQFVGGSMQYWTVNDEDSIVGFIITSTGNAVGTGVKVFVVYSLTVDANKVDTLEDIFKKLEIYAKDCECTRMEYTTSTDTKMLSTGFDNWFKYTNYVRKF